MACSKCGNGKQDKVLLGMPFSQAKGIQPVNKVANDMPMMPVAALICTKCSYIELYRDTMKQP